VPYLINGLHGTGYEPDLYDERDLVFKTVAEPVALPSSISPLDDGFPIYDQHTMNGCVGFAFKAGSQIVVRRGTGRVVELSAGFIWRGARSMLGWQTRNEGCRIRDAIKYANEKGCPSEALYETTLERVAAEPSPVALAQAADHPLTTYRSVETAEAGRAAVAGGWPIIFGTVLKSSFERARDNGGFFPKPEGGGIGAHAMLIVGYDDSVYFPDWDVRGGFRFRNSWSSRWGDRGWGWMPYAHFDSPAVMDAWAISMIKD
jgi:hypothetical protein